MTVANNLGVPLPGGSLATDMLLVVLGYRLTFTLRHLHNSERRMAQFWVVTAARFIAPALIATAVALAWASRSGSIEAGELWAVVGASTQTLNLLMAAGAADFNAIEHLWPVSLLVQFAVLAPLVVFAGTTINPSRRFRLVAGVAVSVAGLRLLLLLVGLADAQAIAALRPTHLDALLIGAAVAVAPLPDLRRRIPTELTPVLFAFLLLLMVAAPANEAGNASIQAVLSAATIGLTAVILAAAAGDVLSGAVTTIIDRAAFRWLGALAVPLLVWHGVFAHVFNSASQDSGQVLGSWAGASSFIVTTVFTLTAAVISRRSFEQPLIHAAGRLVTRRTDSPPGATNDSPVVAAAAIDQPEHSGETTAADILSVAEPTLPGRIPATPSVAGPTQHRPLATAPVADPALAGHGVSGSAGLFDMERGRGGVAIVDGAVAVDDGRAEGSAVAAHGATPDCSAVAADHPGPVDGAAAVDRFAESLNSRSELYQTALPGPPVTAGQGVIASTQPVPEQGKTRAFGPPAMPEHPGLRMEAMPDPKPVGGAVTVGGPGVAPLLKPLRLSVESPASVR